MTIDAAKDIVSPDLLSADGLTPMEMRGKILELEAVMLALPEAAPGAIGRIDIPVFHHFAHGVYLREMRMPKGSVVVGMIHKTEHHSILSKGKVRVVTEAEGTRDFDASSVILSKPGAKRALYALEDVVWITTHPNPTEERDLDKIWDMFVVSTHEQLEAHQKKQIQGGSEPCLS